MSTYVNRFTLNEVACDFARDVVVPLINEAESPWRLASELIRLAIVGKLPEWFEEKCAELEIKLDDVDAVDFYQEVIVRLPAWLL